MPCWLSPSLERGAIVEQSIRAWAHALGGVVVGKSISCPGPGHGKHDRSLSVTPCASAPDGFIVNSFAGDDFRECRDHVRLLLGMSAFAPQYADTARCTASREAVEPIEPPSPNIDRARNIWRASVGIKRTIAEVYLARRALVLDGDDWHRVLRFNPSCPFGAERAPAMIALMRDIVSDEPRCIQRTRLTPDGHKIDRQMLGAAKGAAIKIDSSTKVSCVLSIGEGLETCLSGRAQGYTPAWAVGSAGAIATFPVIAGITRLRIFAENDEANERARLECATRWAEAGHDVAYAIRPSVGKDLNDCLRASFMTSAEGLWPGAALIPETEIQERADFQRELVIIRSENARVLGHHGQSRTLKR